jgi:putative phosphoesterase
MPDVQDGPHVFSIGGRRILVSHDAGDIPDGQSEPVDVIIVGHTHRSTVEQRAGVLLINPGEVGGWVTGTPRMAFLELDDLSVEVVDL